MITDTLKIALANHIESYLIVSSYHWNIEGIDFYQYHSLFSEIYTDYHAQIDILAEYIRIISNSKEYVNASTDVVVLNKTIKSEIIVGDKAKEMCSAIITINKILIDNYQTLFDSGTKENIQGLVDYCATRLDALNKLNWKLLAITK